MAGFVKLLKQKWYPPSPETASFVGRTVLITGATTGLGLEAAKKIACLEPEALIITARGQDRGEKAVEIIKRHAKETAPTAKQAQIHLLLLNMSQFEPVMEFAKKVTSDFPALNTVILNAGCVSKGWSESSTGWEEQLQVNVLSTTLLALLLLPSLLAKADGKSSHAPHLEIVTSGLARIQTAESLAAYIKSETPLSQLNNKDNAPDIDSISGSQKQYARSKVAMEVNMRHIAALPFLASKPDSPKVVVNSACPGMCATDLGREMGTSLALKVFMAVFFTVFGRTADQGSHTLVSALTRDKDGHGKMWKDDQHQDAGDFLESAEGKAFGDAIWHETCKVLVQQDPSIAATVGWKG